LSADTPQWFAVARILRARGNKGEVAVELLTDFPERLSNVRRVFLAPAHGAGEPEHVQVSSFWIHNNRASEGQPQGVFHFAGVDSISQAEQLRGREVWLPLRERVSLPSGMYFVSDLIGSNVYEHPETARSSAPASSPCSLAEAPAFLGQVSDVEFVGVQQAGTPLLHIATAQGELLIPLAEEICFRVSIPEKRIDVRLPEGLRELNKPE
jgi:16S rRNA processing protein RimM